MTLRELDPVLAPLSHGAQGLAHVRSALERLTVEERVNELADTLLTNPLTHELAERRVRERLGAQLDHFNVLQGDIIRTEGAYKLGERVLGDHSYIVATSTCDLIPERRAAALLMPVEPRRRADYVSGKQLYAHLRDLTLFRQTQYFYLPVLADDDDDVLFNVVLLDPLAMCSNEAVNIAQRRASLSLVGWHLFGALAREILIREAQHEAVMRSEVQPAAREIA